MDSNPDNVPIQKILHSSRTSVDPNLFLLTKRQLQVRLVHSRSPILRTAQRKSTDAYFIVAGESKPLNKFRRSNSRPRIEPIMGMAIAAAAAAAAADGDDRSYGSLRLPREANR